MQRRALFDYVLGRNPTGYSFVTGFGNKPPMHPHHRICGSYGIADPIPGMLVGGPTALQPDIRNCKIPYPSKIPAKSYLDNVCSPSTNEIAINWNAPLVYVSGALQVLTRVIGILVSLLGCQSCGSPHFFNWPSRK